MKVIDQINNFALRLLEEGIELPSSVLLGVEKYEELRREIMYSSAVQSNIGHNIICIYTMFGRLTIEVNRRLPYDHVSIGPHALYDLYVDDILLDRDTSWFDESIMNK